MCTFSIHTHFWLGHFSTWKQAGGMYLRTNIKKKMFVNILPEQRLAHTLLWLRIAHRPVNKYLKHVHSRLDRQQHKNKKMRRLPKNISLNKWYLLNKKTIECEHVYDALKTQKINQRTRYWWFETNENMFVWQQLNHIMFSTEKLK